VKLNLFYGI